MEKIINFKYRDRETKRNKGSKKALFKINTNCLICNTETTKQHKIGDFYVCENCKDLTLNDIYIKLADSINEKLMNDPIFHLNEDELKLLLLFEIKNKGE